MSHVDDHDIAQYVKVAELMFDPVELSTRPHELGPRPHLPIVHHHSNQLQLLIQPCLCLRPLLLQSFNFLQCLVEALTVSKFVPTELLHQLKRVMLVVVVLNNILRRVISYYILEPLTGMHLCFLYKVDWDIIRLRYTLDCGVGVGEETFQLVELLEEFPEALLHDYLVDE